VRSSSARFLLSLVPVLAVFVLGGLAYLPFAPRFGYYNDDWYLIYAGLSQGSQVFKEVFASDRPFRAYLVGWLFDWFGVNAPLYSYAGYLMRCLGALGVMWIGRLVWPPHKTTALLLALICLVYPGFLDQPNAIDYQSHFWAFTLAIGSIAFSLQAMQAGLSRFHRAVWIALAVIAQVIALLLMEYYIGLEGLRLALMFALLSRQETGGWRGRLRLLLGFWLPSLAGAVGFLLWRQFIFQNQRGATDIATMFANLLQSPIRRVISMALSMLQDWLNVIFYAWAVPVYNLVFGLSLTERVIAFGLALVTVFLCLALLAWLSRRWQDEDAPVRSGDIKVGVEMALVGFVGVTAALLPVHLGNRQVVFEGFSRFSLPASIGAGLILLGLWQDMFSHTRLRNWLPAFLLGLGVLAHSGNSLQHVAQWEVVRDFWWQVSWRVPQFQPGTVLMADYAGYGIAEDYFIWGPASLIYEAQPDPERDTLPLAAATLDKRDLVKAIGREMDWNDRRGIITDKDFANLLVLAMAKPGSCVHVLDEFTEVSNQQRFEVIALAPYSHQSRIDLDEPVLVPPAAVFGPEPAQGWCYYFQSASLARQRGDWQAVLRLAQEARRLSLQPGDPLEWMPFILAYAYTGDTASLEALLPSLQEIPFLKLQACRFVHSDPQQAAAQFPQGYQTLVDAFCSEGSK
jgi:hypothetical protein